MKKAVFYDNQKREGREGVTFTHSPRVYHCNYNSLIELVNDGYFAVGLSMFSACFASACCVHPRGSREGGPFYVFYHRSKDL